MHPDPIEQRIVPQVDFTNDRFPLDMPMETGGFVEDFDSEVVYPLYRYYGPSQQVLHTDISAMTSDALLPISPPSANASWKLDFTGPAVKCEPLASTEYKKVLDNYRKYTEVASEKIGQLYWYMSWYPGPNRHLNSGQDDGLPFIRSGRNGTLAISSGTPSGPLRIFLPPTSGFAEHMDDRWEMVDDEDGTAVECNLLNSTYGLDFRYEDGRQNVIGKNTLIDAESPISRVYRAFGPWIEGPIDPTSGCPPPEIRKNLTSLHPKSGDLSNSRCISEPRTRQTLAYQSVTDAFTRMLEGSIYANPSPTAAWAFNTTFLTTPLRRYNQLSVLYNSAPSMQTMLANKSAPMSGVEFGERGLSHVPLTEMLEQMFQNLTISLMVSEMLQ